LKTQDDRKLLLKYFLSRKWIAMYFCVWGIDFAPFLRFLYWILELIRPCGNFHFSLFTLFWKNKYFFQYHSQKMFELIYKDWSKLFVRFIRNNLNQVVRSQFLFGSWRNNFNQVVKSCKHRVTRVAGYARVCTTWLRLFQMTFIDSYKGCMLSFPCHFFSLKLHVRLNDHNRIFRSTSYTSNVK
jgi:hypothetical protein